MMTTDTNTYALIGNPNTGKTTLFNALTGMNQRVGNYPGVTVERKVGELTIDGSTIELVDLPGTYSLAAQSPDEMTAVDVLLGQQADNRPVQGVIVTVDATNIRRNLYLVSQLMELRIPILVVLNMIDVARKRNIEINAQALSQRLGVPVIETCARTGDGVDAVRTALTWLHASRHNAPKVPLIFPEHLQDALDIVEKEVPSRISRVEAFRVLVDTKGYAAQRILGLFPAFAPRLADVRKGAATHCSLAATEATTRYEWIRRILQDVVMTPKKRISTTSDRIDTVLTHKVWGTLIFASITAFVFQAIYTWAGPFMDLIDWTFGSIGATVGTWLPEGALRSLLVDGVIGGVGSVLIFLPQILFLFFFLAILEDCGYMARAAFLMDKLFSRIGLSGKSFIPLLSSFACAIPGIMSARTIENRRDRIVTIMVAPLMSCSARLPVYTILIAAFIPAHVYLGGFFGLQGLMLFAMHLVGIAVAIPVIWCLKRSFFKSETPAFVMELPSYKWPSLKLVMYRVLDRGKAFVKRAGTIIFAMTIVVWAMSYFPRPDAITEKYEALRTTATASQMSQIAHNESAAYLEASIMGQLGHFIEPVVKPLGWDWRIGVAALASFPAREVIVAVLGTIYNLGNEVDETSVGLQAAMQHATWPDGRQVFSIPVALSIMIFFALCCQCGATVATIKRETNSWGYAWFTFGYMTALAYVGAFVTYRVCMGFL